MSGDTNLQKDCKYRLIKIHQVYIHYGKNKWKPQNSIFIRHLAHTGFCWDSTYSFDREYQQFENVLKRKGIDEPNSLFFDCHFYLLQCSKKYLNANVCDSLPFYPETISHDDPKYLEFTLYSTISVNREGLYGKLKHL